MLRLYFLDRDNPQIYNYFTKWVVILLEVVWNFLPLFNTSLSLWIDYYEYFDYFCYFLTNSQWSQTRFKASVPEFLVLQPLNKRSGWLLGLFVKKGKMLYYYHLGNNFWAQNNVFVRWQIEKWSELFQWRNLQLQFTLAVSFTTALELPDRSVFMS